MGKVHFFNVIQIIISPNLELTFGGELSCVPTNERMEGNKIFIEGGADSQGGFVLGGEVCWLPGRWGVDSQVGGTSVVHTIGT